MFTARAETIWAWDDGCHRRYTRFALRRGGTLQGCDRMVPAGDIGDASVVAVWACDVTGCMARFWS